jgi:malonate transporter
MPMIVDALSPIFFIMLFGFMLSRLPFSNLAIWSELERLTYYIFFPALLVMRLSSSTFDLEDFVELAKVIGIALFLISLILALLHKLIARDQASLSSVYQGSIRFNTYIGLACIDALYGERGLTTAALCLVVYIVPVNILSVISLSVNKGIAAKGIYAVIGAVATNPLVIACLIGLTLSVSNIQLPDMVEPVLAILSQPALPIGLLTVGAGIKFTTLGAQGWEILVSVVAKFLVFPGIVLGACLVFSGWE